MTADQAARTVRQAAAGLPEAAAAAVNSVADQVLARARGMSQGPLSLKTLRRLGHPYARRHGRIRGPGREDEINKQSGVFLQSWTLERAPATGAEASVFNVAPHASYLYDERSNYDDGGTRYMLGRAVPDIIADEFEPILEQTLEAEISRLFA